MKNALPPDSRKTGQIQTFEQKASEIFISNTMVKTKDNLSFKKVSKIKGKEIKEWKSKRNQEV